MQMRKQHSFSRLITSFKYRIGFVKSLAQDWFNNYWPSSCPFWYKHDAIEGTFQVSSMNILLLVKDYALETFPGIKDTHQVLITSWSLVRAHLNNQSRLVCFSTTCCFEKSVLADDLYLQIVHRITWQQTDMVKRQWDNVQKSLV